MKASELISLLQKKCKDDDPEIVLLAYRWNDDLKDQDYNPAQFERIQRRKDEIQILIDAT